MKLSSFIQQLIKELKENGDEDVGIIYSTKSGVGVEPIQSFLSIPNKETLTLADPSWEGENVLCFGSSETAELIRAVNNYMKEQGGKE